MKKMKSRNETIGIILVVVVIVTLAVTPVAKSHARLEKTNPPISRGQIKADILLKTIPYGGVNRTYYLYVPSQYDGSKKVPLVLALHPAGGTGFLFELSTGWMHLAEGNDFIVAYPDGGIGYAFGFRWNVYKWGESPDDFGFLMALISQLKSDYQIDSSRIYMTGHSSGASMTTTFALRNANVLAAIAPVSGLWITSYDIDPSNISRPNAHIPVHIWRGEFESEEIGSWLEKQYWIDWNDVDETPTYIDEGGYKTEVYTGDAEVRLTEIIETSHTETYDPNTASMIWYDFFVRFSRSASPGLALWQYVAIPVVISFAIGVAVIIIRRKRRRDKQDLTSLAPAVKPS